jgi:hypothetical protein
MSKATSQGGRKNYKVFTKRTLDNGFKYGFLIAQLPEADTRNVSPHSTHKNLI